MTLTQLLAFLTAARTGTFTAAAAELQMSQPAVSDLVRRLEDELETPLFLRGARTLALTAAGEQLLPHAERSVDAAESGKQAVHVLRTLEGGTATFGVLRNADLYLRGGLVRRFHERHPDVRIRLVGQNSAETAEDVRSGRLEAGLVALPVVNDEQLNIFPVIRDEIVYVSAHRERVRTPPTTDDLCDRTMVLFDAHFATTDPMRRQIAERTQLAGRRLTPVMEVEYLSAALDLVAAGFGDTLAPRAAIAAQTSAVRLHVSALAEPLFDTVALVRRHGHPLSPATAEFVRLAHEVLVENSTLRGSTVELLRGGREIDRFLE